VPDIDY